MRDENYLRRITNKYVEHIKFFCLDPHTFHLLRKKTDYTEYFIPREVGEVCEYEANKFTWDGIHIQNMI